MSSILVSYSRLITTDTRSFDRKYLLTVYQLLTRVIWTLQEDMRSTDAPHLTKLLDPVWAGCQAVVAKLVSEACGGQIDVKNSKAGANKNTESSGESGQDIPADSETTKRNNEVEVRSIEEDVRNVLLPLALLDDGPDKENLLTVIHNYLTC